MKVVVDKRTELMSIILALSQGNEYIEEHFSFDVQDEYRQQAYEYFNRFANHKCVKLAKQIARNDNGFNFDNPIRLAFSLDENFTFNGKLEDYLLEELEDEKLIKKFMFKIVDFVEESQFEKFFNQHQNYYNSKIEEIQNLFNGEEFVIEFQKFLKHQIEDKFSVNIIPMLINANHGFSVDGTNVANIGLLSEDFKTITSYNKGTKHTIIHEFCHEYVNCYTANSVNLPEKFKETLKDFGYINPISYLNDTIVRAMTIRLREKIEKINVQNFLKIEESFGFIYVKEVYQELGDYEKQSRVWEEYIPYLLNSLKGNITKKSCLENKLF